MRLFRFLKLTAVLNSGTSVRDWIAWSTHRRPASVALRNLKRDKRITRTRTSPFADAVDRTTRRLVAIPKPIAKTLREHL